jgi:hypothetical protein
MPITEKSFNLLSTDVRALTKEVRDLSTSSASIHGALSAVKWIVGIFIPVLLVACISLGAWCVHLSTKVAVIESGGDTKLVTQLQSPRSPQQLQAALATVTAQVQMARANDKPPDVKKVQALSAAVSKIVKDQPNLPEAWQTAAALVSYRSPTKTAPVPNDCSGEQNPVLMQGLLRGVDTMLRGLHYDDCTVVLDEDFAARVANVLPQIYPNYQARTVLKFNRVHVIYRGGRLPPADELLFVKCTFDFKFAGAPHPTGESLTQTLLTAQNIDQVNFYQPKSQGM